MSLKESVDVAEITVTGFTISSFQADDDELEDIAYGIASGIGMELANLGRSVTHGEVTIRIDGRTASTDRPAPAA